jgi:restriction system protein
LNKKQKNDLDWALGIIFAIIGIFIWYKFFSDNWILFFVFILAAKIIPTFILKMIPDAPSNKPTNKKSTKSKKATKTSSKKNTSITSTDRQLPDNEILKLPLEKMSWREFERLCYMYYEAKGYKPVETRKGADGGVDLVYYHPYYKGKVAVQIKHRIGTGNQVTVKEIRELNTSKRKYDCILAEFITSSRFTNEALKEADDFNIETYDVYWVNNNIVKWQKEEAKKKNF